MKLIPGSSNQPLCEAIAKKLGRKLIKIKKTTFSDGENFVQLEESIRGDDCYIIQSTSAPANDNIMELLLIIDMLKRSSAKTINVVIPYFGYARQDRKSEPRVPISAKLIADLLEKAGADRVIVVDIHSSQIQGFFNIPVDNLYGANIFTSIIKQKINSKEILNPLIASPDAGGVTRARYFAQKLNLEGLAMIDKRREKANEAEVMNVIGDVIGKDIILIDDIVDTGGTLIKAAKALKDKGANSVCACITHGVLSGSALDKLSEPYLDRLYISNSINQKTIHDKLTIVPIENLLSEVIKRIASNESINNLFN